MAELHTFFLPSVGINSYLSGNRWSNDIPVFFEVPIDIFTELRIISHLLDSFRGSVELLQVLNFEELGPCKESLPGLWQDFPGSLFLNWLDQLWLLLLYDPWLQCIHNSTLDGRIRPLTWLWD